MYAMLRDNLVDGMRTYAQANGNYGQSVIQVQTGRRADGGSAYARMEDKHFFSEAPYGVAQYRYLVKVCMDKDLQPDPCTYGTSHQGL